MRAALLALALLTAACGSDDAPPEASGDATAQSDRDDDVDGRILAVEANADGEVEVGVSDAVVFFRLSDATRAEVEKEMEAEMAEQEGLGRAIGDLVTGAVTGALGFTVQIPVEDVETFRYEDGRLIVDGGDTSIQIDRENPREEGIEFDPAAAQRLIDAFESVR